MRKKSVVSFMLSAAVVATMFAGCSSGSSDNTEAETSTEAVSEEESEESSEEESSEEEASSEEAADDTHFWTLAEAEEVPEALYHYTFDGDDEGISVITQGDMITAEEKEADPYLAGATYSLVESDAELQYVDNGAVGKALYMDGSCGLSLDVEPLQSDTYTISFWVNAWRLADYGPTVTFGRNMGATGTDDLTVAWMNITQAAWGSSVNGVSTTVFPAVWNRNSSIKTTEADGTENTLWPWIGAYDDTVHGLREWVMITVVANGERYTADVDQAERVGTQFYINGMLASECLTHDGNGDGYGGISPEIMTTVDGDQFAFNFGVNYWDSMYKGFVDDLYVFDSALTAGEVAGLYALGDPEADTQVPDSAEGSGEESTEASSTAQEVTSISDAADVIDTLGSTDLSMGFWTEALDSVELKDGETKTVKFVNYTDGAANWDNYVVAFTNTETTKDKLPSADNYDGYAEWAVVRADLFAWGYPDGNETSFEGSWGDDWASFVSMMSAAQTTLTISRDGADVTIVADYIGSDGNTYNSTSKVTTGMTADDPCYFFLTGEKCYIELLSVE